MIFRPQLADLVARGVKTETRRPVKPGEPCRYRVARTYAVQPGRGKPAIAHIRIIDVHRETLGHVDTLAVAREGFASRRAFIAYWRHLYGRVDLDQAVWAIRFELADEEPAA